MTSVLNRVKQALLVIAKWRHGDANADLSFSVVGFEREVKGLF
jgi:hypothetical protein